MGVERSGTSLVVNLVRLMDFYSQVDNRNPDEFNEYGYGESRRLVATNDEILEAFGGNRFHLPRLNQGWEGDRRLDTLRVRADEFVAHMNTHERWVWKDPVLTLTFPFWKRFLPPDHLCVICIRNPLAVLKSQARAFQVNPSVTTHDWYVKNLSALVVTSRVKTLVVSYEDYFTDPTAQINRLAKFVGGNPHKVELPSASLRHFDFSLADTMRSKELPTDAKILYLLLLQSARCGVPPEGVAELEASIMEEGNAGEGALRAEIEYYRRIAYHPYVRLGRKMHRLLKPLLDLL